MILAEEPLPTDVARERVIRLFKFVAALYDQRNPSTRQMADHEWSLRLLDVPDHISIDLKRQVEDDGEGPSPAHLEAETSPVLLRCARPALTAAPPRPAVLEAWLGRDWEDCAADPKAQESKNERAPTGETVVHRFDESLARVAALDSYRLLWLEWAKNERIALKAGEVFEQLYALHGKLQRDGERYELVIADGILSWARPGGGVRHPLLTRTVQLEFDPEIPEFRIIEGAGPTEFYASLFRSMEDVDGAAIGRLRDEVSSLDPHPLGGTEVVGLLRSTVTSLSSRGKYVGPSPPGPERPDPEIGRGPVFILRKRTVGMARAIDAIVEQLQRGAAMSRSLLNVVGVASPESPDDNGTMPGGAASASLPEELSDDLILFTKDANPEQLDIARRLERDDCVLVQGPPGTGKTHTIANLLGHLLAQGKSVLVVSHTTKALKVLREKVVDQLQPLCVSVLDSKDDDAALKSSIEGIVERIGNADPRRLDREIERLDAERKELVDEVRSLESSVLNARLDEQREIIVAGEGVRPIVAAKEVAAGAGEHDWIPADVVLGQPLPLTPPELAELYLTNSLVAREDEQILTSPLPEPEVVANPADFTALCRERRELAVFERSYRSDLWKTSSEARAEDLDRPLECANEALEVYRRLPSWTATLVEAGSSMRERAAWDELLAEIEAVRAEALDAQSAVLTHTPSLAPDTPVERAGEVYGAISHDVGLTGKAPGFLTLLTRPEWKIAIQGAKVGAGQKPSLLEHFVALAKFARVEARRAALRRRWVAQVESIGGVSADMLGTQVEVGAQKLAPLIRSALDWTTKSWAPAEKQLESVGLNWLALRTEADATYPETDNAERIGRVVADILPQVLAAERARRRWLSVEAESTRLRRQTALWPDSEPVRALRQAVSDFDDENYRHDFAELERLRAATEQVRKRSILLARLEKVAPGWASEIRARAGRHGEPLVPGDAARAWRWRQFENELNRRHQVAMSDLMRNLEHARHRLREATTELVDRKAWRGQIDRTSLAQRQALLGFAEAKRRIGRGTGKRAAQFARVAQERMSDARSAVPVWIMPVIKAAEVFDPSSSSFDVVIVDEASQSDVTGLIAFYLGKQVVVVGDDEQVSPSAVGEKANEAQHLIDEMLQGIPDAQLFDGKQSLYDIAKRSFGGTICLLEHFRCVPDIIQFSNELSYAGRIKPLREPTLKDPSPAVVEFRVASDGVIGKRNESEARAVAALVMAAMEQPEYDGKTFGVISMVGEEQAYRIEEILRAMLPPAAVEARRLLAGNAAQFQGDERNVIFLSLVDVGQGAPLSLRSTRSFQQRYNVAASRAQDQLWVVHSLDRATDLKIDDLRRRLIEHAADPGAADRNKVAALKLAESPFEEEVIERLASAGYSIVTQHRVGAYRIDIVVQGTGSKRLAVECDGDRYHTIDKLREDSDRQSILERLGWTFVRIRGSRFYRDQDAAMRPVFERLATMRIDPHGRTDEGNSGGSELLTRIKGRAAELEALIADNVSRPSARFRRSRALGSHLFAESDD